MDDYTMLNYIDGGCGCYYDAGYSIVKKFGDGDEGNGFGNGAGNGFGYGYGYEGKGFSSDLQPKWRIGYNG